jgi:nucleoid-associated protein YgaU
VPATPSKDFLEQKAGPLPVWAWAAIGLVLAYLYSKYRTSKTASSTTGAATTSTPAGEPSSGSPYFVIEDSPTFTHSSPVPTSTTTPPTTTPPGTTSTPPVSTSPPPPPVATSPPPVATSPPPPTSSNPASPTTKATYTVVAGDTLSKIAAKYGTTWQAIWSYNLTPGVRPAATQAKLQAQGPNLIYAGQSFLIPS